MIENISDEQARHMVDILKKKSKLIKNFYHKIEKDRLSRDKQTYKELIFNKPTIRFPDERFNNYADIVKDGTKQIPGGP